MRWTGPINDSSQPDLTGPCTPTQSHVYSALNADQESENQERRQGLEERNERM